MWYMINHLRDNYKEDIINHLKDNYKENIYANMLETSCPYPT